LFSIPLADLILCLRERRLERYHAALVDLGCEEKADLADLDGMSWVSLLHL
jgi:hypothetical protein